MTPMTAGVSNCANCKHRIKHNKCDVKNKFFHKPVGICNDFTSLNSAVSTLPAVITIPTATKPKIHNHDTVWAIFYP